MARAMKRIGDKGFLHAWQTIRAATQPGPEANFWHVGEVTWHRHRLSHSCPDFAVVDEVYRLDHTGKAGRWSVLVTMETWWDNTRHVIRAQVWAAHLGGSKQLIQSWMAHEAEALMRRQRPD